MDALTFLISPGDLALCFGIAVFAGVIKGLVGFALPLILISGMGSVIDPELALAGLLFLVGAIRLFQVRQAPGAEFNGAKGWTIAGGLVAFLVWFLGFMVVAGEWFAMWQSATWNGQSAAFRFYLTALAVLIFVNQPDGDLAKAPATMRGVSASPGQDGTDASAEGAQKES